MCARIIILYECMLIILYYHICSRGMCVRVCVRACTYEHANVYEYLCA